MFYVDETDPEKLVTTSINSMLSSLDPYTTFIPESDMDNFKFQTTGEWKRYCHSGKRPKGIPCQPEKVYEGKFQGLRDWIGLPKERFMPFAEAINGGVNVSQMAEQEYTTGYRYSRDRPGCQVSTLPFLNKHDWNRQLRHLRVAMVLFQ